MTPPPAESGAPSSIPARSSSETGRDAEAQPIPKPPRRAAEPGSSAEFPPRPRPEPQPAATSATLLQRLKGWLDLALVADVFLVIAAALWFALAVVLHSRGVEAPLHLFQLLWEPLFTPAIGLLMAAALLSGALGWWQRRGQR